MNQEGMETVQLPKCKYTYDHFDPYGPFTVTNHVTSEIRRWPNFDALMQAYDNTQRFADRIVKLANDFDTGNLDVE